METSKLINGDCLEELKKLDEDSVDLLCTDPPYGYGFMGKHWDTFQEKQSTKSQKVGWMSPGMTKSTYGMKEFFVPIWEEALRVLKPGGFAFVMSAPRSDVQTVMVQTLQEAGFDVSFTPIYWTYATGFPKAMNIGKAVDKRLGVDREVVGKSNNHKGRLYNPEKGYNSNNLKSPDEVDITIPKTDKAKELDGSYGGFQPKPAWENIIVCMKPLSEKGYLDQAMKNGKGVTWLDDCRVPFQGQNDIETYENDGNEAQQWEFKKPKKKKSDYDKYVEKQKSFKGAKTIGEINEGGNTFLGGDMKQLDPSETYQKTDDTAEASPMGRFPANLLVQDDVLNDGKVRKSGKLGPDNPTGTNPWAASSRGTYENNYGGDEGSFSRYYDLDVWWEDRVKKLPKEVQRTFPFLIVPKASKSEKNMGLENNIHPTVKPIDLMSYLVVLGSRKNDVVLDPFSGSGTTGIACVFSERNYILIEREKEYFKIMEARIKKAENPAGLVQHEWF